MPSTLTTTQAPLARKLLHCHYLFRCSFFLFAYSFVCVDSGDEEEEKEETEAHGAALTSTSQTLVLSEDRRTAEESSPPPQQDM